MELIYFITPPTLGNGKACHPQADAAGNLKVTIAGSGGGGFAITSPLGTQTIAASVAINPATSSTWAVTGNVAPDAVDAGNPVKIGGYAASTAPAAVAPGDRVNGWYNLVGSAATFLTDSTGGLISGTQPGDAQTTPSNTLGVRAFVEGYNGSTWDRWRNILGADGAGTGIMATVKAPMSAAAAAITPVVTSAAASSLVLKASAGNFYGANIVTGGTAGYLMLFNATSAPADGAVAPVKTWVVAANSSLEISYDPPIRLGTGITLVFSSTGPFTKTASATAFISGEAV